MQSHKAYLAILILFALCLVITFTAYVLYKNSCAAYPELTSIEEVIASHPELVLQIETAAPEFIDVYAEPVGRCAHKGRLVIVYSSRNGKKQILNLLTDDKYFFGIPILFRNV